MLGFANLVNTLPAFYLTVMQVCTPNPVYVAATQMRPLPEDFMTIQPAFCVSSGDPLIGKRPGIIGMDSGEKCAAQQKATALQAQRMGKKIVSMCVRY